MDDDSWPWKSSVMKTWASVDVGKHVVKFKYEAAEWRDELRGGGWEERDFRGLP